MADENGETTEPTELPLSNENENYEEEQEQENQEEEDPFGGFSFENFQSYKAPRAKPTPGFVLRDQIRANVEQAHVLWSIVIPLLRQFGGASGPIMSMAEVYWPLRRMILREHISRYVGMGGTLRECCRVAAPKCVEILVSGDIWQGGASKSEKADTLKEQYGRNIDGGELAKMGTVKWGFLNDAKPTAVRTGAKEGIEAVRAEKKRKKAVTVVLGFIREALKGSNLYMVDWLLEEGQFPLEELKSNALELLRSACGASNTKSLVWLVQNGCYTLPSSSFWQLFQSVCTNACLDVCQWLVQNAPEVEEVLTRSPSAPYQCVGTACVSGNLPVAKWLCDAYHLSLGPENRSTNTPILRNALFKAASGGHSETVKWLLETFPPNHLDLYYVLNSYGKNLLPVLQYIVETYNMVVLSPDQPSREAFYRHMFTMNLTETFLWLISRFPNVKDELRFQSVELVRGSLSMMGNGEFLRIVVEKLNLGKAQIPLHETIRESITHDLGTLNWLISTLNITAEDMHGPLPYSHGSLLGSALNYVALVPSYKKPLETMIRLHNNFKITQAELIDSHLGTSSVLTTAALSTNLEISQWLLHTFPECIPSQLSNFTKKHLCCTWVAKGWLPAAVHALEELSLDPALIDLGAFTNGCCHCSDNTVALYLLSKHEFPMTYYKAVLMASQNKKDHQHLVGIFRKKLL